VRDPVDQGGEFLGGYPEPEGLAGSVVGAAAGFVEGERLPPIARRVRVARGDQRPTKPEDQTRLQRSAVRGRDRPGLFDAPVLLLIMLMTNNRAITGSRVNTRPINILGRATTAVIFATAAGVLITTWFI
jgi:hypothetical protein